MSKRSLGLMIGVMIVIAALALPTWAHAISNGSVSMIGPNVYRITVTGDTDDIGIGYDAFCVVCTNATGLLNDIDIWFVLVGFTGSTEGRCDGVVNGQPVYDVTVTITDPSGVGAFSNENSAESAAYCGVQWLPGPDMVSLDGGVVGSFVATTAIYFAPQAGAATSTVMEAGKTVYVFGVDASGEFYKVELSGSFFWVPVSTMGPNYDSVWNGTPLPTKVVE